jgi:pyruvate, orthophosphate dikinase
VRRPKGRRRRLVQQYGEVVHGVAPTLFESRQRAKLAERDLSDLDEIDTSGLREIADGDMQTFETATGRAFPSEPQVQLRAAIEAVLRSWSSERARDYRKLNGIADGQGTASTAARPP